MPVTALLNVPKELARAQWRREGSDTTLGVSLTTVESVIIVGEEKTDELITQRERNDLTGEEA